MSDSMALAFAIGVAFGFTLERAGLGSARKLAAQFDCSDMTVLKVMFSAIVTAMLGVFFLGSANVIDSARLALPHTWIAPQAAGAALFGAGFAIAGLCPGTACVAAATGRGDGVAVIAGLFAGVLGIALVSPAIDSFYTSGARGRWTLGEALGLPTGTVVLSVVVLALAAFALAGRLEARA
jgi:hypothetical protein